MPRTAAVGLDIGSRGVRVVELTAKRGKVKLANFGSAALPPSATSFGEVHDVGAVAATVSSLLEEMGVKKPGVVWVGVSDRRVMVRPVSLPKLDRDELYGSLALQVEDQLPVNAEELELDFIPTGSGTTTTRIPGLLVAAPRTTVSKVLTAVGEAGVQPSNIDLHAFALLRPLAAAGQIAGVQSEALIDIGAQLTDIVVHHQGDPQFIRVLPTGGDDITTALQEGLDTETAVAERIKATGEVPAATDAAGAATPVIDAAVQRFVGQVADTLQYYTGMSDRRVETVWLSGGGSLLAGLTERLEEHLAVPVHLARPFAALDIDTGAWDREQFSVVEPTLVTAAGLAAGALQAKGVDL